MMGVGRGMVAIAAVTALGFLTIEDVAKGLITPAQSFTAVQSAPRDKAVTQNAALRERAAASVRLLTANPDQSRAGTARCREQSWPYYSGDCLVRSDGRQAVPAVRIVGDQRRARVRGADRAALPLSWVAPEALQYGVVTVAAAPRA